MSFPEVTSKGKKSYSETADICGKSTKVFVDMDMGILTAPVPASANWQQAITAKINGKNTVLTLTENGYGGKGAQSVYALGKVSETYQSYISLDGAKKQYIFDATTAPAWGSN